MISSWDDKTESVIVTDLESFLGLPVCKVVSEKCFIVKCRRNQYRRNPRWKILYFDSAITIPEYGGIGLIFSLFNFFNPLFFNFSTLSTLLLQVLYLGHTVVA